MELQADAHTVVSCVCHMKVTDRGSSDVVAFRQICCLCNCCYVPRTTSTLMSLLMKAGLSLNVFWQGISKPLLPVDSALMFKRLYCALVWLILFRNSVSCYKINPSFLVTLTERLHSWYWINPKLISLALC